MTYRAHVKELGRHNITGVFIFLLIGMFTIFSLLLVLVGVQVYRSVVTTSDINGHVRASISYVANKIRTADGAIAVKQMDGVPVLTVHQPVDEDSYETRIYFLPYEQNPQTGALYEQMVSSDEPFDPELGEMISEVKNFSIAQDEDIIQLHLETDSAEEYNMTMRLRAENMVPGTTKTAS